MAPGLFLRHCGQIDWTGKKSDWYLHLTVHLRHHLHHHHLFHHHHHHRPRHPQYHHCHHHHPLHHLFHPYLHLDILKILIVKIRLHMIIVKLELTFLQRTGIMHQSEEQCHQQECNLHPETEYGSCLTAKNMIKIML